MRNNAPTSCAIRRTTLLREAHEYFDRRSEGFYNGSYDSKGAYANVWGRPACRSRTVFKQHNSLYWRFGVPSNDSRWIEVQNRFVEAMNANGTGHGLGWRVLRPADYSMRLGNSSGMTNNLAAPRASLKNSAVAAPPPAPTVSPPRHSHRRQHRHRQQYG
jgi:hypothetical protein